LQLIDVPCQINLIGMTSWPQSQFDTSHQVETIYVKAAILAREFLQSVRKNDLVLLINLLRISNIWLKP
jgi:streptomycin 6-kinase